MSSIYAISDLHLSLSIEKPMDVFGDRWSNYMQKLKQNWASMVSDDDYVIIPGDISWATYLNQCQLDFEFIHLLPGKKIILKGNHDYWWSTLNKINNFLNYNGYNSINLLQNNSYKIGDVVICGTRGWKCPGEDEFNDEDKKIYERELQRLELSLKSIVHEAYNKLFVAMHFPPINSNKELSGFIEVMKKYNVNTCIYGHLHGSGIKNAYEGIYEGIELKLVSADYLNFTPHKL